MRLHVGAFTVGAETRDIEPKRLGIGLEKVRDAARLAPDRLILIKHIVHLPEFSLDRSRLRGERRGQGMLMHFERKLVENDAHFALVLLLQFVDRL